jgi:hypothetical protein
MCETLKIYCEDPIAIERYKDANIGLSVRIYTYSKNYTKLDDPVSALRNAFESYMILKAGTTIQLLVGNEKMEVDILDTFSSEAICIRGVELTVIIDEPETNDIMIPQQEQEQEQEQSEDLDFSGMFSAPLLSSPNKFPGTGYVLGGKKR